MVFVYLRDGRRLDVEGAMTFAQRGGTLICLDKDGDEVKRFQAGEVTAYGHAAYPYDPEFISKPLDPEEREPTRLHHRRRRSHSSTRDASASR